MLAALHNNFSPCWRNLFVACCVVKLFSNINRVFFKVPFFVEHSITRPYQKLRRHGRIFITSKIMFDGINWNFLRQRSHKNPVCLSKYGLFQNLPESLKFLFYGCLKKEIRAARAGCKSTIKLKQYFAALDSRKTRTISRYRSLCLLVGPERKLSKLEDIIICLLLWVNCNI